MGNSGGTRIRSRRRRPARTGRVVLTFTIVALIGWGAFLLYEIFGSTSTEYDRAMADCISSHTQGKDTLSGEDARAIASACSSSIPAGH